MSLPHRPHRHKTRREREFKRPQRGCLRKNKRVGLSQTSPGPSLEPRVPNGPSRCPGLSSRAEALGPHQTQLEPRVLTQRREVSKLTHPSCPCQACYEERPPPPQLFGLGAALSLLLWWGRLCFLTRYCVSVRPNDSGFTVWLCRLGQRYPGAVWTKELRLEPVATVSSGHRP